MVYLLINLKHSGWSEILKLLTAISHILLCEQNNNDEMSHSRYGTGAGTVTRAQLRCRSVFTFYCPH